MKKVLVMSKYFYVKSPSIRTDRLLSIVVLQSPFRAKRVYQFVTKTTRQSEMATTSPPPHASVWQRSPY